MTDERRTNPARRAAVRIGGQTIGPGRPVYVVAEAGVNHDGDAERALRLVDIAAQAGADAVKFQVFQADRLASSCAETAGYQKQTGARSQRDMLQRLELGDDALARVRQRCQARGLELLATPFGVEDVDRLLALRVPAIKIASTDLNNLPLLERAVATDLPLIVSTGAARRTEILDAVERFRRWQATPRLILLHCVSCYPTPLEAANLRAIRSLHELSGVPCGFSDHTISTQTGAWAVAAGACVLEKHFTYDRTASGPDHAMSLQPDDLREYIANARQVERALGSGRLEMNPLEEEVRRVARRSVVAARPLSAGTVLSREMLALKRPSGGVPPDQLDALVGRRLRCPVEPDAALSWDMVQ